MHILVVNDDGILAKGIYELAKELATEHRVTVIAPEEQKSAQSHAITIYKPLVVKKVKLEGLDVNAYSVSGTPADCVRAGIEGIIDGEDTVDIVVSGVNHGLNLGMDILYSGTVSAAIEASLYDYPAIAVSADIDKFGNGRFDIAAKYVHSIIRNNYENLKTFKEVINVNVPNLEGKDVKGVKPCKLGEVIYDFYTEDVDEHGQWIVKPTMRKDETILKGTDRYYLRDGFITVTPLRYNFTNFEALEEIRGWLNPSWE